MTPCLLADDKRPSSWIAPQRRVAPSSALRPPSPHGGRAAFKSFEGSNLPPPSRAGGSDAERPGRVLLLGRDRRPSPALTGRLSQRESGEPETPQYQQLKSCTTSDGREGTCSPLNATLRNFAPGVASSASEPSGVSQAGGSQIANRVFPLTNRLTATRRSVLRSRHGAFDDRPPQVGTVEADARLVSAAAVLLSGENVADPLVRQSADNDIRHVEVRPLHDASPRAPDPP